MAATGFPVPDPAVPSTSQIAALRADKLVLRNSVIVCWITVLAGALAFFLGICAAILCVVSLFPLNHLLHGGLKDACWWGFSALVFVAGGGRGWSAGRSMREYQVALDESGVNFNLGTRKEPSDLFLPWDQVSAIKRKRTGNVQQFWVEGKDGSEARFSSYTFFRPMKVARKIAERAGLTIQKF